MNEPTRPPLTTTTSILPAALVLGIAVVTLIIFLAINFIANPRVTTTSTTVPIVVGGLATMNGSSLLTGCQQPGTPPSNISDAFLVPVTTRATNATQHPNGGAGDYDCLRSLSTRTSPSELLGYYSAQLQSRGWNLFSKGAANGSSQLLFQKAGSDTFYWIVGITVDKVQGPTTFWTYRIYQNSSMI